MFIDQLGALKEMALAGCEFSLVAIKNLAYNLPQDQLQKFESVIDLEFIKKFAFKEQGMLLIRQVCSHYFKSKEAQDWLSTHLHEAFQDPLLQTQVLFVISNLIYTDQLTTQIIHFCET